MSVSLTDLFDTVPREGRLRVDSTTFNDPVAAQAYLDGGTDGWCEHASRIAVWADESLRRVSGDEPPGPILAGERLRSGDLDKGLVSRHLRQHGRGWRGWEYHLGPASAEGTPVRVFTVEHPTTALVGQPGRLRYAECWRQVEEGLADAQAKVMVWRPWVAVFMGWVHDGGER